MHSFLHYPKQKSPTRFHEDPIEAASRALCRGVRNASADSRAAVAGFAIAPVALLPLVLFQSGVRDACEPDGSGGENVEFPIVGNQLL